jgi:hypothetical protein
MKNIIRTRNNSFLTVLIMLSIISIGMTIEHAARLHVLLLITIAALIMIYPAKTTENGNQK